MKKILLVIFTMFMAIGFSACKKKNNENQQTKKTVIKYCTWGFGTAEENNMTRRLIQKYNEASDKYRVELMIPDGVYDEFLTTMASGNNMPDVFMVNSVPSAVINKWALDLSDIVSADEEWTSVQSSLKEAVTYSSKTYAIPNGQYHIGYAVNYDLVNTYLTGSTSAEELFTPGGFTYTDLFKAVRETRDINKTDGTGVIGIEGVGDMINWLPSVLDQSGNTKHFVWNGTSFDYTSNFLISSFTQIQTLGNKLSEYTLQSIRDAERQTEIFGSTSQDDVFANGQMGFLQVGTYSKVDYDFDYKFIGLPNGRVIVASDYLCLSASLSNNEEKRNAAYDFAKYMSFSKQGYNDRFTIIDENPEATNLTMYGTPIISDQEISDKWFSYVKMPGAKEVYEGVNSGDIIALVEGNKTTPGFIQARFTYETGISIPSVRDGASLTIGDFIWDTCAGDISIGDYQTYMSQALANSINGIVSKAYQDMGLTR